MNNKNYDNLWNKTKKFYSIKEIRWMSTNQYYKAITKTKFYKKLSINQLPVKTKCNITEKESYDSLFNRIRYALNVNSLLMPEFNCYKAIELNTNQDFYIITNPKNHIRFENNILIKGLANMDLQMGDIFLYPNNDSLRRIIDLEYID